MNLSKLVEEEKECWEKMEAIYRGGDIPAGLYDCNRKEVVRAIRETLLREDI